MQWEDVKERIQNMGLGEVKVLFADDDEASLSFMQFWANDLGWYSDAVTSADGIIEAVNKTCGPGPSHCYDAIVADVNYIEEGHGPRINGISAARAIRNAKLEIPILFVSGFGNSIIREEVRRVRAEIVSKPVEAEWLFEKLATLIVWNRLSTTHDYDGPERRCNSVNRTDNFRRPTDKTVEISDRVSNVIIEAQEALETKGE